MKFVMLINDKMPTIAGFNDFLKHQDDFYSASLNVYEQLKFHAHLS